jgi:hypothetical protein
VAVASRPYGPNTPAVRGFLRDLSALPPATWARAARVWATVAAGDAVVRADAALGAAIENAGLERERDAVVAPLVQLATAAAARLPAPGATADALAEAALAAALALLARGLVPEEAFDALYAPFAAAVPAGAPP